jgi:hypothetical protein
MRERTTGDAAHELTRDCARAHDLVNFLYGEADPAAARDFQTHLRACAECRGELAAFGEVRARVGEWRAEGLCDAPSLGLSGAFAPAAPLAILTTTRATRVRSARAALREFFSLSPLWLRAGACAAPLFVCVLAALTLARTKISWGSDGLAFEAGVPERVVHRIEKVEVPAPAGLDEAQLEAVVRERVRAELDAAARVGEQPGVRAEDAPALKPAPHLEQAGNTSRRKRVAPRATPRGPRRLEDDESLPRLSDLLSGVY